MVPSDTYLAVDHMGHGHSKPHPHTVKIIEAQVVQNGPQEHTGAQHCSTDVGFIQSIRNFGVFKVTNHFPQK